MNQTFDLFVTFRYKTLQTYKEWPTWLKTEHFGAETVLWTWKTNGETGSYEKRFVTSPMTNVTSKELIRWLPTAHLPI